jgi:hypothetical protein
MHSSGTHAALNYRGFPFELYFPVWIMKIVLYASTWISVQIYDSGKRFPGKESTGKIDSRDSSCRMQGPSHLDTAFGSNA